MKLLTGSQHIENETFATIGFFDGVHVGHRFLLAELKRRAALDGLRSLVVSFADSPLQILAPEKSPLLLSTPLEKTALFEQIGVDDCLILNFDKQIAAQTSREFLRVLHDRFGVRKLLIGYDHHFGSDRLTSFADYQKIADEIGVKAILCDSFSFDGNVVASSKIRAELLSGDVAKANRLLGYNYTLSGVVSTGEHIGRKIGFPTANLAVSSRKLLPKVGVYAVVVTFENRKFNGLLNIGMRPTVNNNSACTVEVHLLDFSGDLYGKTLTLAFLERLRDEQKFDSLEALKNQIEIDKNRLKTILS